MLRLTTALATALCLLTLATPAAAQQQQQQTTTVLGVGSIRVKPDTASLSLAVRRAGRDQGDVRDAVNRRTVKLYRRLLALGLDAGDITTAGVRLSQKTIRGGTGRRARHIRYLASDEIGIVTGRLDLLGPIFDTAVRTGATDLGGPFFSLQNPTPARTSAVSLASRDARARAEAAAAELGMRVVGVQSFDIDGYYGGYPAAGAVPAPKAKRPPTTVSPGTAKIEARVRVVFLLDEA